MDIHWPKENRGGTRCPGVNFPYLDSLTRHEYEDKVNMYAYMLDVWCGRHYKKSVTATTHCDEGITVTTLESISSRRAVLRRPHGKGSNPDKNVQGHLCLQRLHMHYRLAREHQLYLSFKNLNFEQDAVKFLKFKTRKQDVHNVPTTMKS